jgi:hypothetical protein
MPNSCVQCGDEIPEPEPKPEPTRSLCDACAEDIDEGIPERFRPRCLGCNGPIDDSTPVYETFRGRLCKACGIGR